MIGSGQLGNDISAKTEALLQKRDKLLQRLRKGREVIRAEAEKGGGDRADQYFEVWLSLLTDYEQTMDELRALGVPD